MLEAVEMKSREGYWMHVQACLVRFHSLPEGTASKIITDYQTRFPLTSEDPAVELIYHFEPFRLACKITGKKLSVRDFAQEYREILEAQGKTSPTSKIRIKYGTTSSDSKVKESATTNAVAKKTAVKVNGAKKSTRKAAASGTNKPTKKSTARKSGGRKPTAG
jgi:hypothetical protein